MHILISCGWQVLEMREAALGRQHPEVAACLNNLAVLLKTMGRHAEAQGMYERCIAIKEQAMGPTHPQVSPRTVMLVHDQCTCSVHSLRGVPLLSPPISVPVCVHVIRDGLACWRCSGIVMQVALSLANLAALMQAQGRTSAAEELVRRALSIREDALWPDHPLVSKCSGLQVLSPDHLA